MNAGPTSERIYLDIHELVTSRETAPGIRLDPAILAQQFNASTTPVREALNRLVGERLVETRTSTGYHLPLLDEPALKDLIGWSADILNLALRRAAGTAVQIQLPQHSTMDYPDRIAAAFSAIVHASGHAEYIAAISQANARLHAVRLGEPEIFADLDSEFERLSVIMQANCAEDLRKFVTSYHRRRLKVAAELLRKRYRTERNTI